MLKLSLNIPKDHSYKLDKNFYIHTRYRHKQTRKHILKEGEENLRLMRIEKAYENKIVRYIHRLYDEVQN